MHILELAYACDSADGLHLLVYVNNLLRNKKRGKLCVPHFCSTMGPW